MQFCFLFGEERLSELRLLRPVRKKMDEAQPALEVPSQIPLG